MTLESFAVFLCGGLKIRTKHLNMVQGFPKVNFSYGILCYKKYGLFLLCVRSRQWEHTCWLINLHMPQLYKDSSEFMSSNMVQFLTFILISKNI
jgi:hypothetical protein